MKRVLLVLALLAPSTLASAQATLITGLGGPLDFGTDSPPRSDDDTMPTAVSLTATFPGGIDLYGQHYTDVFVNVNGALTFGGIESFSPDPFPRPAGSVPMIAGWWANVDTRPIPAAAPDTNQIYYAATSEHFVVTWIDVGYFDMETDKLDAFQIILTPSISIAGAIDVELRYHRCEWTTGDDLASGGTGGLGGLAAQAGFDVGDGVHVMTLPGSGTAAVLSLCTMTNDAMPGSWGFTVGGPARCGNGFVEPGEDCDDGNSEPHDFCDDMCVSTVPCYTSFPDGGRHDPLPDAAMDAGLVSDDAAVGPCELPDANLDDAAIVPDDAAIVPIDAARGDGGRRPDVGVRFDADLHTDAAVRMDASAPMLNQLDVAGGGCGCRAGRSRDASGYVVLAMMALLSCIRARARARAGTSRRP